MKKVDISKWVPKGNLEKYELTWLDGIVPRGNGIIGAITNSDVPDLTIRIVIDDEWMYENNQRECCVHIPEGNYNETLIIVTKGFVEMSRTNEDFIFSIWHEIGHYHTMHYFPEYAVNGSAMRKDDIMHGKISTAEYVADLFGLYYSGEKLMLSRLQTMIRNRHKEIDMGDSNALMAWHEMRQRRNALKELHDDKIAIVNEINKMCDV